MRCCLSWGINVPFLRKLAEITVHSYSQESSPEPQLKSIKFFCAHPSLWFNSHIHTWVLKNHCFDHTQTFVSSSVYSCHLFLPTKLHRWQEYIELDNHDAVVTCLKPDILKYEVEWVIGGLTMNKANGGDRIPAELFQILKDEATIVLHSNEPANLEDSAVATGLEKVSFHSNLKEGQGQRMFKLPYSCTHLEC